jgi:hypothetical protein
LKRLYGNFFSVPFSIRDLKVRGMEFVMRRHQLVASADDVILLTAIKMAGIDVNVRKSMDIFTSSQ